MNAAVKVSGRPVLGDLDDFAECVEHHAWFYSEGWIDLHTAVDNLQRLAERWGVIEEVGQDRIQEIMAAPFAHVRGMAGEPDALDAELAEYWQLETARRIARWEEMDRSNPDPPPPAKPAYRPPQATIDAFFFVAQNESPEYLADWLTQHPRDLPHLQKIWEAKCSTAPAV